MLETPKDVNDLLQIVADGVIEYEGDEHKAQLLQLFAQGVPPMFLTGSRVYGKPKKDSDLDFVIFTTEETMSKLGQVTSIRKDNARYKETRSGACLYFGKLNLICETNPKKVIGWWNGTRELEAIKPVSKTVACTMFDRFFQPIWDEERKAK